MSQRGAPFASLLIVALLLLAATDRTRGERKEVSVAAAANLTHAFGVLGPAFERETGVHPVFSFGSTARLAQQIENGAPWDVFAGADAEHAEQLERKGLLTPGSRAVYATGVLVLWVPSPTLPLTRLEDLDSAPVSVIALARPDLAPYGLAAKETLQNLHLWPKLEAKLVYAENIDMARQYGATGNADAVFTAAALTNKSDAGHTIEVPETLHRPIRQALGIVAASPNQAAARQFADFLLTGEGHRFLLRHGYR